MLRVADNYISAVSTDGRRLALSKMLCIDMNKPGDLVVPAPALKELGKIFNTEGTAKIFADDSTVWFRLEDAEFSVRRIDASFPKYEKILNDEVKTSMKISKSLFLPALERIDVIAKNNTARIMAMNLNSGGELRISSRAPELGTVSETLDAAISGDTMQVGFNVTFFMDGVKAVNSDKLSIEFSDQEGQTRMYKDESDDFLYMLMPIRLSPQDIVNDDEPDTFTPYVQQEETSQNDDEPLQEAHEFGDIPQDDDSDAPF